MTTETSAENLSVRRVAWLLDTMCGMSCDKAPGVWWHAGAGNARRASGHGPEFHLGPRRTSCAIHFRVRIDCHPAALSKSGNGQEGRGLLLAVVSANIFRRRRIHRL